MAVPHLGWKVAVLAARAAPEASDSKKAVTTSTSISITASTSDVFTSNTVPQAVLCLPASSSQGTAQPLGVGLAACQVDVVACSSQGQQGADASSSSNSNVLTASQWNHLAEHAVSVHRPDCLLLLSDGYMPVGDDWVERLRAEFEADPAVLCLALGDEHEPGHPCGLALSPRHLQLLGGRLFPKGVEGPDANCYLWELYRRVGGSGSARTALVASPARDAAVAAAGGEVQTSSSSSARPSRWLTQLEADTRVLRSALARDVLAVDVLVPSYRVIYGALTKIIGCRHDETQADVRFVVQIDNPRHSQEVLGQLHQLRKEMRHRFVIRKNEVNVGRSDCRNACLDASGAEFCIFFDDDVQPMGWAVDAYVRAFRKYPKERCFAGPTFMPLVPRAMPMAVHMSGVIDFWEVPHWYGEVIPWAVTANVAYRNSDIRFRFPKKGGGEDVDYCLLLGARTVAVPDAQATHPWWPGTRKNYYKRMFRWFEGDGQLIKLWPELSYLTAPSALMCCAVLALCALLRLVSIPGFLLASVAVWLSDVIGEVVRECCFKERRKYTPGPMALRPHAALESALLKSVSEFGRVYGHIKVGKYANVMRKFDWFCRYEPTFVATQQRFAAAKFALFLATAAAALALTGW